MNPRCHNCGQIIDMAANDWLEYDGLTTHVICWGEDQHLPLYSTLVDYDRIDANYRYIRALIWELRNSPFNTERGWSAIQRIMIKAAFKKRHYGRVYKMSHPDKEVLLEVPYVLTDDIREALALGYVMEPATGAEVEAAIHAQVEKDRGIFGWKNSAPLISSGD